MSTRREAREVALQVLFQFEFIPNLDVQSSLELYRSSFKSEPQLLDYSRSLVEGIIEHKKVIDEKIQSHSSHWKLNRMALVDLNVMRIATFEMSFAIPLIPPKVAIDEAIEIARYYGSQDSASFVNGILDQIAREYLDAPAAGG
jgi:transcription antitermination protein NusB